MRSGASLSSIRFRFRPLPRISSAGLAEKLQNVVRRDQPPKLPRAAFPTRRRSERRYANPSQIGLVCHAASPPHEPFLRKYRDRGREARTPKRRHETAACRAACKHLDTITLVINQSVHWKVQCAARRSNPGSPVHPIRAVAGRRRARRGARGAPPRVDRQQFGRLARRSSREATFGVL